MQIYPITVEIDVSKIPKLILASASPRRQTLLKNVGCDFTVEVANVDESHLPPESPQEYAQRVACLKADAVQKLHQDSAILAADTIVSYQGQIFGKPRHQDHAFSMWQDLSDAEHDVITAICLQYKDEQQSQIVSTKVKFAEIHAREMELYWQSGEPQDKAGGYAIQGLASAWVVKVTGSYSNVVGLPLFETNKLLARIGHNWL
jgi:septum formation protein